MQRIAVVDSHTGGEPTRVVIDGAPDLGSGTMSERLAGFRTKHDHFRSAIINEPRGSDVLVGALLCEPRDPVSAAGVIFFNNVGYLGMCGHGLIGVVVTLAHLGRIRPGTLQIETPVGNAKAIWEGGHTVSIVNVPSYRKAANVPVHLPNRDDLSGDVAWGGNWFYLVHDHGQFIELANIEPLTALARRIRRTLNARDFPEIDHIELFGPPRAGGNARNFVLCPGNAYDRSPCGTGLSAKLACLAAAGSLEEGAEWVQESIIGSTFRGSFRWLDREKGVISPTITGTAFITGESFLFLDDDDPFRYGIQ